MKSHRDFAWLTLVAFFYYLAASFFHAMSSMTILFLVVPQALGFVASAVGLGASIFLWGKEVFGP